MDELPKGYRICGAHAREFSQTLGNWNRNNEIRQSHIGRSEDKSEYMEISTVGTEKMKSDGITTYRPPGGRSG